MSDSSSIEWTEATWNPVVGCAPVSAGCLNCYAATMARRIGAMGAKPSAPEAHRRYVGLTIDRPRGGGEKGTRAVFNGTVRCVPEALGIPLKWRRPRRIFVNSMSDLFHESVPFEFIDRVFAVMALCPQHTFQVLTKRPERMAEYTIALRDGQRQLGTALGAMGLDGLANRISVATAYGVKCFAGEDTGKPPYKPFPNVWLGTSCEDQETADLRIPHLLRCPAAVRFLSCEPLLGPIDLSLLRDLCREPSGEVHLRDEYPRRSGYGPPIDWIIVGGESGPGARSCNVEWIRDIVRQCKAAEVACFVKQLGASYSDPKNGVAGRLLKVPKEAAALLSRRLTDRKGGDPSEWPADLNVREMPR